MKLAVILIFLSLPVFAQNMSIFDTKKGDYIEYNAFIEELNNTGYIVLGEFHNNQAIQNAQAKIINDKVQTSSLEGNFKLMWEFLNFTKQESINNSFAQYMTGVINAEEFITINAGAQNLTYAALLNPLKTNRGEIVALNLDRKYKKIAMNSGLGALDPELVPDNFHLGSDEYLERFKSAMGGHASDQMIKKYYMAQCLTDSVMSFHAHKNHTKQLSFIVAGSFHTDFDDATVAYLKELTDERVTTIKIVTGSDDQVAQYLTSHSKYGDYARYIVISN